jgi:hypothetical protein
MKAFVLLVLVVGLTASCDAFAEPESFAYQYAVRGNGENVRVPTSRSPRASSTKPSRSRGGVASSRDLTSSSASRRTAPQGQGSNALFVTVRSKELTGGAGRVRLLSKTAGTTRHDAPSITSRSPDRETQEASSQDASPHPLPSHLRRTADRLRGGPNAQSGAGRMLRENDPNA